ncbi:MAG: hypothetical protein GKS02_11600 [Alphaproteobacteria bacterium]|nr:hypothetical protein [Alphaproteobacteria bacterium]
MVKLSTVSAIILASFLVVAVLTPTPAAAEPFQWVRIGDIDGFGFSLTRGLVRPVPGVGPGPADTNDNGTLEPDEFLPDLNADGGVWFRGDDNFDNRSQAERANTGHACQGCQDVGEATGGSRWTDLALSPTATASDWPDINGPAMPNSAAFIFDFTVARGDITPGGTIFFNLVFGDYDIDPAVVRLRFANAAPRILRIPNQQIRGLDGLIQVRTANLRFDEVFTADADGNWHGRAVVIFDAPADPFTAFDYVELSLAAEVAALSQ